MRKQGLGPASLADALLTARQEGGSEFYLRVHPDREQEAIHLVEQENIRLDDAGLPVTGIRAVRGDMKEPGAWELERADSSIGVRYAGNGTDVESKLIVVSEGEAQPVKVPALILDRDGTVAYSVGGYAAPLKPEDIRVFEGVEAALWKWRGMGYFVFGVANVEGVAAGTITPEEAEEIHLSFNRQFEVNPFNQFWFCYNDPNGTVSPWNIQSLMRKPSPGLLVMAEYEAYQAGFVIDWPNSLMVGDGEEDRECAERAGIRFLWAKDFFKRKEQENVGSDSEGGGEAVSAEVAGGGSDEGEDAGDR